MPLMPRPSRALLAALLALPALGLVSVPAAVAQTTLPADGETRDPFVRGTAGAGAAKATPCVACHGVGGNGVINPEWPKLAGQHSAYVAEQLKHFKAGTRKNAVMNAQAQLLSEQDMLDLGAHFGSLKPVPGVASKASLQIGEKLYRAGDATRGLPACGGCHGPGGAGNPASQYPRIGGQHAAYTAIQLAHYKNGPTGERGNSKHAQIMQAVAVKLTDAEIAALASYVNGLK